MCCGVRLTAGGGDSHLGSASCRGPVPEGFSANLFQSLPHPPVSHPLVNVHPVTGEKALRLDPVTAAGIEGRPEDESRDLLAEIRTHATKPDFVYAHEWQIGDIVMWDNGFLTRCASCRFVRARSRVPSRAPGSRHTRSSGPGGRATC